MHGRAAFVECTEELDGKQWGLGSVPCQQNINSALARTIWKK